MDKFYAYVGLTAALALAVFFLYPFGPTSRYPLKATPLDNDAISAIVRSTSDTPKLIDRAYDFQRRCSQVQPGEGAAWCKLIDAAPDLGYIYDNRATLSKFVPDIDKRLDAYFEQTSSYSPNSPILIALKRDIVIKYPELFASYRQNYMIATYVIHGLFLVLIGAMLWYRRSVGRGITTAVAGPFRLAGKALAGVHKRV
jgi:hypothetical protein